MGGGAILGVTALCRPQTARMLDKQTRDARLGRVSLAIPARRRAPRVLYVAAYFSVLAGRNPAGSKGATAPERT
jgi:hypothetical protein